MGYRTYSVANGFTVAKDGTGDFTTISAALAVATSGTDIFITPGVYTESPTMTVAGVNLVGFMGDSLIPNVTILGTLTANFSGVAAVSNINLQTNSANSFVISGSNATAVYMANCNLNCTNATGISFASSSSGAGLNMYNCTGNLATTGIALYSSSSTGTMILNNCLFGNSGGSTTATTNSAGLVSWIDSELNSPLSCTGTGGLNLFATQISTAAQNTVALILNSSASVPVLDCSVLSGSATAITVGASNTLFIAKTNISSTAANTISVSGAIKYTGLFYSGNGVTNNIAGTNVTRNIFDGGFYLGTNTNSTLPSGVIGETLIEAIPIGSAITLSTATPANIAAIALTTGIWDVTGILSYSGTVTGTNYLAGVATTSASFTGVQQGNNGVQSPISPTAASDNSLTIPVYRVLVTVPFTNYYLLAQATFTVGTCIAYGRISATRVA